MDSKSQHKNISMPVDFVIYNWHVSVNGEIYHSYQKDAIAHEGPNQGKMVTDINIIDRDLAEIKFEEGAFIIVKNINSYGTIIKEEEKIEIDE